MEVNRELSYSVEAIMDDYGLVFKTKLIEKIDEENLETLRVGEVEEINKE